MLMFDFSPIHSDTCVSAAQQIRQPHLFSTELILQPYKCPAAFWPLQWQHAVRASWPCSEAHRYIGMWGTGLIRDTPLSYSPSAHGHCWARAQSHPSSLLPHGLKLIDALVKLSLTPPKPKLNSSKQFSGKVPLDEEKTPSEHLLKARSFLEHMILQRKLKSHADHCYPNFEN